MKKILYITFIDQNDKHHLGIIKKIKYQKNAMEELGYNVDFGMFDTYDNYRINYDTAIKLNGKNRRDARRQMVYYIDQYIKNNKYDYVYIRGESFDNIFLNLIKMLKSNNLKIILEIPTYPIKNEIKSSLQNKLSEKNYKAVLRIFISSLLTVLTKPFYKKYVDLIVTYMDYKKIWGINVCYIDNAIDCNSIKPKSKFEYSGTVNLLGVANVSKWHGFDRVIEGLADYKGDVEVKFNIVGEGSEIANLKMLVDKYRLNDSVKFLGMKDKDELDDLFEQSHIAISSLGMHRINMSSGSTLKTKEYCARGIPFILAYDEVKLNEDDNGKMYLKVKGDETPLNIDELVKFYNKINYKNISIELRQFAVLNYSWTKEMKKLFNYMKRMLEC